jgi:hypothetical protein
MLERSDKDALALTATNMGPITVTLHTVVADGGKRWWRRRPKHFGLLNPLDEFPFISTSITSGPFGRVLPRKVEVGEQFSVYLIADHEELAKDVIERVGFSDTFGRNHWAPKKHVLDARAHIREACDRTKKSY